MFGKHFYNKNIRNIVVLFGTVFNDITIKRTKADGTVVKQFKVPIAYGPAQKYITIIEQGFVTPNKTVNNELVGKEAIGITLPRMSFEIVQMNYDGTRKLQTTKKIKKSHAFDNQSLTTIYTPVPYNFDIELSVMVKNSDDGTQILEQILPFFTPEFQVTMNEMSTMGVKRDVPIILNGIDTEDTYEGDMLTRRTLIHTLSFQVQGHIYGYTGEQGIIKEVDINSAATFNDNEFSMNTDVKQKAEDPSTNEIALSLSNTTGTFTVGEVITSSGGATGTVVSKTVLGHSMVLTIISGIFAATQTITGGTSNATSTIVSVSEGKATNKDYQPADGSIPTITTITDL